MNCVKVHYEVVYNGLLTFKDSYRDIVIPFIKSQNVQYHITNEGTTTESIVIQFLDLNFLLDFRWDKLIIIIELEDPKLSSSTSIIRYFFEVLDKVKALKDFNRIRSVVLSAWYIKKMENTKDEIIKHIQEHYLSDFSNKILSSPNEFLLELIDAKSSPNKIVRLGPFEKTDLNRHKILNINAKLREDYESVLGLLCNVEVSEINPKINISSFKEYYEINQSIAIKALS
jgi:hypothetical protein